MATTRNVDKIAENVYLIQNDLIFLYLIIGEQSILIDSSESKYAPANAQQIETMLADYNPTGTSNLQTILLTHLHGDHTGGCSYLKSHFDCTIYSSNRADSSKFLSDKHFKNGDKFYINANQWLEIIDTPGHTPCSASFLLEPAHILFPGDATGFFSQKIGIMTPYFFSYLDYITAVDRFIDMEPNILAPAHNRPIRNRNQVMQVLTRVRSNAQKLKDRIITLLQNLSQQAVAEKLMAQLFSSQAAGMDKSLESKEKFLEIIQQMVVASSR